MILRSFATVTKSIVDLASCCNQFQYETGSEEELERGRKEAQVAEAEERRQQSERKLHETLSVLKENVADTSGEALWSSASSQVNLITTSY